MFTLWTLNLIAVELENPFGTDPNDIDGTSMQDSMNNSLRLLMEIERLPVPTVCCDGVTQHVLMDKAIGEKDEPKRQCSFGTIWKQMEERGHTKTTRRFHSNKVQAMVKESGGRVTMVRSVNPSSSLRRLSLRRKKSKETGGTLTEMSSSSVVLPTITENTTQSHGLQPYSSAGTSDGAVVATSCRREGDEQGPNCQPPQQGNGATIEAVDLLGKWETWDGVAQKELRAPQQNDNRGLSSEQQVNGTPPLGNPAHESQGDGLHERLGEIFFNVDTMEDQSADELLTQMSPRSRQNADRHVQELNAELRQDNGPAELRHDDLTSQYGQSRSPPETGILLV